MSIIPILYWVLVVILAVGAAVRERQSLPTSAAALLLFIFIGLRVFPVSWH